MTNGVKIILGNFYLSIIILFIFKTRFLFITGTMGHEISGQPGEFEVEKGGLYSLKDGKVTKHLDKVTLSNGIAWSLDKKKLYYNDSLKYRVYVFDYDITDGQICE